jgi:hypothetical protein
MRKLSKNYDWVRFWVDPTAELHLTDGAFLVDPRHSPGINEHARTLHDLRERPCLVLLGEQGVGKTREVQRYLARHPARASRVLCRDISILPSTLPRKLSGWT